MLKKPIIAFFSVFALSVSPSVLTAQDNESKNYDYRLTKTEAPFRTEPIKEFIFPDKEFRINFYGGVEGGEKPCTRALFYAIKDCHESGGGRVIVPQGIWRTGAVQLLSNVNLHLEEGAELIFTDNPADYFPGAATSWEGMECVNYSPLIYAFESENVAVTGKGTITAETEIWNMWSEPRDSHYRGLKKLYEMAQKNVNPLERNMIKDEYNMRPQMIQFNRCNNVLLDGFKIKESPFWTIHMYKCNGGIARNLNIFTTGLNNDGINIEMTRNFIIENCIFDQKSDAISIRSGCNYDVRKLDATSENIIIKRCRVVNGNRLLAIGNDISAGVRNVYMHDCTVTESVSQILSVNTNVGGFVENIHVKDIKAKNAGHILKIDTGVDHIWKNIVTTTYDNHTRINGINIENAVCESSDAVYVIMGDAKMPVTNVNLKNIKVSRINEFIKKVENADNVIEENTFFATLSK